MADMSIDTIITVKPQTYMFEGREYVLTKRRAIKQMIHGKKKIFLELMPLNISISAPNNNNFNRWVLEKQLVPIIVET